MYKKFFKRPIDIFCALAAIIVFSWLYIIVAILVRIKLGSPVLFRQERAGRDCRVFTLYKFRTMTDERDENGNFLPDEIRLTKFGKLLRSTSLDELPGFFNVLKGELSLIGPRPLPSRYLPYYTKEEIHRHDVSPGITGWAQVNGRNYVSWEDKFRMDMEYVKGISFIFDIRIIFKTVQVVLMRKNIETGSFIEHEGKIFRPLDVERKEKVHH